jgi:hypothetical protein
MMGALASFSYLVLRYQWFNNVASQQFKVRFVKTQRVRFLICLKNTTLNLLYLPWLGCPSTKVNAKISLFLIGLQAKSCKYVLVVANMSDL